MGID
jgi:hypothetical protein